MSRRPLPHIDRSNSTTSRTSTPQGTCYPERATKIEIEKNGRGEHSSPSERSNRLGIKYGYMVKPNKHRICIDPKDLDRAIKQPHYPLPTVEEVATSPSKAKVFSVLDAKSGFWQVPLDEASSRLTTFNTPSVGIAGCACPLASPQHPRNSRRE